MFIENFTSQPTPHLLILPVTYLIALANQASYVSSVNTWQDYTAECFYWNSYNMITMCKHNTPGMHKPAYVTFALSNPVPKHSGAVPDQVEVAIHSPSCD